MSWGAVEDLRLEDYRWYVERLNKELKAIAEARKKAAKVR